MTTEEIVDVALPTEDDVGELREWRLPTGKKFVWFTGRFIGISTSRQELHYHVSDWPKPDERCRACRWFEPRIFRESNSDRYLVHRTGRSIVPGEVPLTSHEWVRGPYGVIEALTTRRRDAFTGSHDPYLTQPAARVLAVAAAYDDDLERAYIDRAVA